MRRGPRIATAAASAGRRDQDHRLTLAITTGGLLGAVAWLRRMPEQPPSAKVETESEISTAVVMPFRNRRFRFGGLSLYRLARYMQFERSYAEVREA